MVFHGTVVSEILSGRTPRLFVVVHSGKRTIGLLGYRSSSVEMSTRRAFGKGDTCGGANDRRIACSREICSTRRVFGYEAVKIGSNIAARYTASIGDVKDDAMTDPGPGRRAFCCFERDLPPSVSSQPRNDREQTLSSPRLPEDQSTRYSVPPEYTTATPSSPATQSEAIVEPQSRRNTRI